MAVPRLQVYKRVEQSSVHCILAAWNAENNLRNLCWLFMKVDMFLVLSMIGLKRDNGGFTTTGKQSPAATLPCADTSF